MAIVKEVLQQVASETEEHIEHFYSIVDIPYVNLNWLPLEYKFDSILLN
jgi:hypothetical protein